MKWRDHHAFKSPGGPGALGYRRIIAEHSTNKGRVILLLTSYFLLLTTYYVLRPTSYLLLISNLNSSGIHLLSTQNTFRNPLTFSISQSTSIKYSSFTWRIPSIYVYLVPSKSIPSIPSIPSINHSTWVNHTSTMIAIMLASPMVLLFHKSICPAISQSPVMLILTLRKPRKMVLERVDGMFLFHPSPSISTWGVDGEEVPRRRLQYGQCSSSLQ
ncbi:hypothetical protein EYC84_001679 [Monilinia fructicola]|uniref:Uncharacterized protein n=1 Tax=Monilinia fructicola TaxID=38448 RepID=A0A5M9JSL9_MONFR|nr:hypothetical protein EYC84_001679 [Monilinia fructicola]